MGVEAGESLDEVGKPRFFSHSPVALLYKVPLINPLHWYWKYLWHKHTIVCRKTQIFKFSFRFIQYLNWRPPSLSELTPMVFNTGLTQLGSEASN